MTGEKYHNRHCNSVLYSKEIQVYTEVTPFIEKDIEDNLKIYKYRKKILETSHCSRLHSNLID